MNTQKRLGQHGQTLVEAVVVVGVVVLLVTGLVAGTTASLRAVQSGRTKTQAVTLAQEGMEIVRSTRDQNWTTFQSYSGEYCLGDDKVFSASTGSCMGTITTPEGVFGRTVSFNWQDPSMEVTVTVSYIQGEEEQGMSLVSKFTQWK
jgi:Tfp pilus assembly protein PilV